MVRIIYTTIFLLLGRVLSFTAPKLNVELCARSIASSHNGLFASVVNENGVDDNVQSESHPDSSSTKSELEQFVAGIRSLYQDLEQGGGSIRREMNGLSFTYIAPSSSDNGPSRSNNQLDGEWRFQEPITHDADNADWGYIHKQTTEERTKFSDAANPPPFMLYLPGLDGFGISATTQFDDLSSTFELWRMTIDKGNTQLSFSDLLNSVVRFIDDATKGRDSPREVLIVGESFGGLLAVAVTMALKASSTKYNIILKGMVLVNPATSFDETQWEQFVPFLTSLRYLETQEEVDDSGNFRFRELTRQFPTPYSIIGGLSLAASVPSQKQQSNILDFILKNAMNDTPQNALSMSSEGFRILAEYLPAAVVEHRVLKWLPVGTSVVNNLQRLGNLDVPTLVIAGIDDNMLPTKEEANRLAKVLPNCVKMDIAGSGHFVLDSVNLTEVLLDSHIDPLDNQKPYDSIKDWTLPPKDIIHKVIETRVKPQRENTSPVFFSTDSVTGKRRKGLSLVPSNDKPLLFVANHQLFGQDLGMIIAQLIEERGISARGLMHPIAADGFSGTRPGEEPSIRKQKRKWEVSEGNFADPDLFPMFGAVKVNPRNFYRLLQTGQAALLFPGGVREALHGKNEDYKVFWPAKTDFVRVAARFNATIVPLAAIGAADSVNILLDSSELLDLPFGVGESLGNFSKNATSARFDVDDSDEIFIPPLAFPRQFPARHYFLFGRSFDTSAIDPKDKQACQEMYQDIENELKSDIDALLQARKDDPFAMDGIKRTTFRRLLGKEPPTFPLESLQPSTH